MPSVSSSARCWAGVCNPLPSFPSVPEAFSFQIRHCITRRCAAARFRCVLSVRMLLKGMHIVAACSPSGSGHWGNCAARIEAQRRRRCRLTLEACGASVRYVDGEIRQGQPAGGSARAAVPQHPAGHRAADGSDAADRCLPEKDCLAGEGNILCCVHVHGHMQPGHMQLQLQLQ